MFVIVSKEKCDRAKSILVSIVGQFDKADDRPNFGLKDMKKKVSFIVHIDISYPLISPLLKVFYIAMNSCIEDRDNNIWKM